MLDYVRRDMTRQEGGFYSAEDADSVVAGQRRGAKEKAEGAFYVWTKKEIDAALGEEAAMFDYHYGVEAEGNAPAGGDPQGEFRGKEHPDSSGIRVAETAKHVWQERGGGARHLCRRVAKSSSICGRNARGRISTTKSSPPGTA